MSLRFETLDLDDELVVVAKPAGLATIRERDPGRPCLHALVQDALGSRLWIVHRIDKETSGLVLFARNAAVHRALSGLFERRELRKTYQAVVHGDPGEAGLIRSPLRSFGSGRTGVDPVAGKPAETRWRTLRRLGPWSELEVEPASGRRHQIRAHLFSIGHPVVGDPLYGDAGLRAGPGRMLLHAARLRLEYPAGRPRDWSCPPPPDFQARLTEAPART